MPAAKVDKSNANAAKPIAKAIAKPNAKKTTRKYTKKDVGYWSTLKQTGHERVRKMEEAAFVSSLKQTERERALNRKEAASLERARAELERMRQLHRQMMAEARGLKAEPHSSAVAEPAHSVRFEVSEPETEPARSSVETVAYPARSSVEERIDNPARSSVEEPIVHDKIPMTVRRLTTRPTITDTEIDNENEVDTDYEWTTERIIPHNTECAEADDEEMAWQMQRSEWMRGFAEEESTAPQLGRIVGTDADVDEDGGWARLTRRASSYNIEWN